VVPARRRRRRADFDGRCGVYPLCWLDAIIRIVTPNKRDSEKTKIAPSHLYLADLLIKLPVTD
jgi:hypothetical protein